MTTTSAFFPAAQTPLQTASSQAAAKTESAPDADSSGRSSAFGRLLVQKKQGKQAEGQTGGQTAADDTAQTPSGGKAKEPDELHRQVAAALAVLSGLTAPVQIQVQEAQPRLGTAEPATVSAVSAAVQQGTELQNDAPGQFPQLPRTAQQAADQPEPGTQPRIPMQQPAAVQTASANENAPAVQITAQATAEDTAQDTESGLSQAPRKDDMQIRYTASGENRPLFRQVEATPVKVGQPPTVDTQSPALDARLADEIGKKLDSGAQRMVIRLTPENLGAVTVDLTRSGDGSIQVVLHTATDKAADLLTQHSAALGQMLQTGTQNPVQVKVLQHHEENQYLQQHQDQSGGRNSGQEQQQRRNREDDDFLQQLRLGLVPADEQAG